MTSHIIKHGLSHH